MLKLLRGFNPDTRKTDTFPALSPDEFDYGDRVALKQAFSNLPTGARGTVVDFSQEDTGKIGVDFPNIPKTTFVWAGELEKL